LENARIKAVFDNQAKRSFSQADINTIIVVFDAPDTKNKRNNLENPARFVMFKKPFENVIKTDSLLAIEKADQVVSTRDYRVYPIKQEKLLEEGWGYPEEATEEEKEKFGRHVKGSKFVGSKWGGKYLRAPDIFFKILEKGKDELVRLGDIAEVRFGIKTGANEFFYLTEAKIREWGIEREFWMTKDQEGNWMPNYVIKSPRECESLGVNAKNLKNRLLMIHREKRELKDTNVLRYIKWGESQGFHKRPSCKNRIRWYDLGERKPASVNLNYLVYDVARAYVGSFWVSEDFHEIHAHAQDIAAYLNSTIFWLIQNLLGRVSFGGGLLRIQAFELRRLPVYFRPEVLRQLSIAFQSLRSRPAKSVFEEIGASQ
jgi:hypothetical protein